MVAGSRAEPFEVTTRKIWNIQASWLFSVAIFLLIIFFTFYTFRSLGEDDRDSFSPIRCSYKLELPDLRSRHYCPPATNVFFLKTHKCASSTVQNVIMRYGDKRNLLFALPKDRNYIGHPEKFSRSLVEAKSQPYNLLCHHLRLDMKEVRSVLPADAIFVTVLRNPVTLFQSMYDYYNMTNFTGVSLDNFVNDASAMSKLSQERLYKMLGRNQMLFDMGYDSPTWTNDTLIQSAIREVDEFFDLVMIAELFEESMILLKHKLCWEMEDIVYLVHNKRRMDQGTTPDSNITIKIREYNKADQMLYDHFLQKLNTAIDEFGRSRMEEEVQDLRMWNQLWFDHCIAKMSMTVDDIPEQTKAYSSKVYSFVLKKQPIAKICRGLATEELQFTEKLRKKQNKMF